jgi:solute carrier family 25 carnitine/acylcarnitine transporter 20/29
MSSEYQNNSLAGVFAALTSLVAGHPFDTVTVRMQSSSTNYRSSLHCLTETVKSDGALALYRGFVPELFSRSTTSAMRFTVQAAMNKQVAAQIVQHQGGSQAAVFKDLPLRWRATSEAMGGAACGVVLPLIFTPAELIKCKKQVLPQQSNFSLLTGVLKAGGVRALYTGHVSTVARTTIGNFVLFGSYEVWKSCLSGIFDGPTASQPSRYVAVASGVLSGCCVAFSSFPIDAAKSRQQIFYGLRDDSGRARTSLLGVLKELKRERALYRGVGVVVLRSIPLHGMYLPCYDFAMQFLEEARPWGRGDLKE